LLGLGGEGGEDLGQQKIKSPFGGAAAGEHDRAAATARVMVNCAGLNASAVARAVEGADVASVPDTRYAKGNYFALGGHAPFERLILETAVGRLTIR